MPRKPEMTRRSLLESAAREFLRNGYEATGLNTLTTASGLTKGALFHHFAGKEALALAVVEEMIDPAIDRRWLEPLAGTSNVIDSLKEILAGIESDFVRDRGEGIPGPLSPLASWLAAVGPMAPVLRDRIGVAHRRWRDAVAEALRRGREAGTVHRAIVPADEADFLLAWFHGVSLVLASSGESRPAGVFQAAMAYLETLRPAGA